jgi:choline kinase
VPLSKVFDLQGMGILKENEKNYLKSFTSDTQILIPLAGSPPDQNKLKKVDKFIAKNYPVSLLEINEKNILDRILESGQKNKISKFTLVTGYKSEKFNKYNTKNIKLIKNKNFIQTSQLDSIVKGLDPKLNSIVIFSDLIIESEIVNRLIKNKKDICLVIDTINENTNKYGDFVYTQKKPIREGRKLTQHRENIIKKIENNPEIKGANFEFIGACYFSKKGSEILLKEYSKIRKKNKKINFNLMINHLVKKKIIVDAIEINGGWMEIRSKEHFDYANKLFK